MYCVYCYQQRYHVPPTRLHRFKVCVKLFLTFCPKHIQYLNINFDATFTTYPPKILQFVNICYIIPFVRKVIFKMCQVYFESLCILKRISNAFSLKAHFGIQQFSNDINFCYKYSGTMWIIIRWSIIKIIIITISVIDNKSTLYNYTCTLSIQLCRNLWQLEWLTYSLINVPFIRTMVLHHQLNLSENLL